ncbi:MAG: hypothetical protein R3D97_02430 [Paracoccaceae bacterium]
MTTKSRQRPDGKSARRADRRALLIEVLPGVLEGQNGTTGQTFIVTRFATLDATVLARIMPDIVYAPLLGRGFDILDVATLLVRLGYRGQLLAVTAPLPNPAAVIAEIRSQCKTLDIGLFDVGQSTA